MNIAFPIIKAGTGSDVYFQTLQSGLKQHGISSEIIELGYRDEFIPYFHKRVSERLKSFDIIHSNCEYGFLFKQPGIPLIITFHHNVFENAYQQFTSIVQKVYHYGILKHRIRRSIKNADAIVFVSNATRKSFQHSFPTVKNKNCSTIYNGISPISYNQPIIQNKKKETLLLLFVGSLSKRKGADLLEPIMRRLGDKFRLRCVTRSIRSPVCSDQIEVIQNATNDKLLASYAESQIFLFPTRLEGFGLAVAEAMSFGLPVISTNCSSLPELVVHGKGGYLCELGNVNEFAAKLNELASSPVLRRQMGEFNRARVEKKFTIDRMVSEYKQLFEEIRASQ